MLTQSGAGLPSGALENQRAVGATKTEIIFDSDANPGITRSIGAKIQVTFSVLIKDVDGRRDFLMMQGEHGEHRLDTARAAQQVARHGLGRADHDFAGMRTKRRLDGIGLVDVAQRS